MFHRYCPLLVLAIASVAGVSARAVDLTASSPFLPPNGSVDAGATSINSPLELHGILSTPEGYKFNLCDQSGHINVWIGLNGAGQPFVVRSQDVAHNRVTVEYQGRELTLSLAQAKITPMYMQPTMPMPMPMPQQPQMMGQLPMQQGMVNGGPEDGRRRLERIAEEIRRRRAMRAGMQPQFPQGGGQVPGYPQPYPQAYPQSYPQPQQ
jgi:hypothetical protein